MQFHGLNRDKQQTLCSASRMAYEHASTKKKKKCCLVKHIGDFKRQFTQIFDYINITKSHFSQPLITTNTWAASILGNILAVSTMMWGKKYVYSWRKMYSTTVVLEQQVALVPLRMLCFGTTGHANSSVLPESALAILSSRHSGLGQPTQPYGRRFPFLCSSH